MARLPTATDLGQRPRADSGRQVATLDPSGFGRGAAALAKGGNDLGEGISKIGSEIGSVVQADEVYNYAKANAGFSTDKIDLDAEFQKDPDYATASERYQKKISEAQQRWAVQSGTGRAREKFLYSTSIDIARGTKAIEGQAFGREASANNAWLDQLEEKSINQLVELSDQGERAKGIKIHRDLISAQVAKSYMTPAQGEVQDRKFRETYATADALARARRGDFDGVLGDLEAGALNSARQPTPGPPAGRNLKQEIKNFEGFIPKATWDYKQHSVGYGTLATSPDEVITEAEAEVRLDRELAKSAAFVDKVNPNLPAGARDALTSLTFNAGGDWSKSELGARVKAGDMAGARERLLLYTRAGGQELPGLVDRRRTEAAWFDAKDQPVKVADASGAVPVGGGETVAQATPSNAPGRLPKAPGTIYDVLPALAREQLIQRVQGLKNAQLVDEQRRMVLEKKAAQDASDKEENELLKNAYGDDPSLTAKDVVNNDKLTREAKERMVGVVARATRPEPLAKVSHETAMGLLDRIRRPDGDPNKITDLNPVYDAFINGDLSKTDFGFVRKEFTETRTPDGEALGARKKDFLHSIKPMIDKSNPLMGVIDPSGTQQLYLFNFDLDRKVEEYRKAGKNPYDLFDPSKPDFAGRPEAISPYQKTTQQSLQDSQMRMTPALGAGSKVPAAGRRRPGEIPWDYWKRTGKE